MFTIWAILFVECLAFLDLRSDDGKCVNSRRSSSYTGKYLLLLSQVGISWGAIVHQWVIGFQWIVILIGCSHHRLDRVMVVQFVIFQLMMDVFSRIHSKDVVDVWETPRPLIIWKLISQMIIRKSSSFCWTSDWSYDFNRLLRVWGSTNWMKVWDKRLLYIKRSA